MSSHIGLIGLATMGANLARNIERNGYTVSLFNRTVSKVDDFMKEFGKGKNFVGCHVEEEFVASLAQPRKILLMVKAGEAVDATIAKLLPHLDQGDIIIDGGNSFFQDTIRRTSDLAKKGILFMGVGISGGEEGALHGPSIMPGGSKEAWEAVREILQKISARTEDGTACCDYVGENGAGHYVKMVHNGIEYGDMQLIAESYSILKNLLGYENSEIAEIFDDWNQGPLSSYLIEITAQVVRKKDPATGGYLLDSILDVAEQKGTGSWTVSSALELGVPLPSIASAVFERSISSLKEERLAAARMYPLESMEFDEELDPQNDRVEYVEWLEMALYLAKISSYAQGMSLISQAAKQYNWSIDLAAVAKLWQAGCIIRADLLQPIVGAYKNNPQLKNLLLDPFLGTEIKAHSDMWRHIVSIALLNGISVPAFAATLSYFDSYRSGYLSTNLIQGLRDLFGAHTFQRIDKEGTFHAEWGEN